MRNREKGTTLALVAIMLPFLVGALGLVVDGGYGYDLKRRLQTAADAAALSAAQELRRGNEDYSTLALRDAERNGFTPKNATVELLNPPKLGARKGDASFVQARLRAEAPRYFSKIFSSATYEIEASAVAGVISNAKCIYTLDPKSTKSLQVAGNASIDLGSCGIHVNSSHAKGANTDGNGEVHAGSVSVVGNYSGSGFFPVPVVGALAEADPWAGVPTPKFSSCKSGGKGTTLNNPQTLNPGVFCGGITINTKGQATLKPGLYVIYGGGLKVKGSGTISGDGVTFFITEGPGYVYDSVDLTANSTSTLSAATTGPQAGILFFQDRNVSSNKVNNFSGKAAMSLSGGLYFPTTNVKFTGTTTATVQKLIIIAYNVALHGKTSLSAPDMSSGSNSPYTMRAVVVH